MSTKLKYALTFLLGAFLFVGVPVQAAPTITYPVGGGTGWGAPGGLSSGSILFGQGLNPVGTSTNLFWDNTNSRLGIATTTPLAKLDVFGSINTDATIGGYQIDNLLTLTASTTLSSLSIGYLAGAATTTTGTSNVAIGFSAMRLLTSGGANVAIGNSALANALTTNNAVAIGNNAMLSHTGSNTVVGQGALAGSGGGNGNVAIGVNAGVLDSSGANNTFLGTNNGGKNTTGGKNIFVGANTATTTNSQTGSNNIALGYDISLPVANGSNQLDIGNLIYG